MIWQMPSKKISHALASLVLYTAHPLITPVALGTLTGCMSLMFLNKVPNVSVLSMALLPLLILYYTQKVRVQPFFYLLAVLFGLFWASYQAQIRLMPHDAYPSQNSILKGEVLKVDQSLENKAQFDFKVFQVCEEDCKNSNLKLRLFWERAPFLLKVGQTLEVKAKIKSRVGLSNPGGGAPLLLAFLNDMHGQGKVLSGVCTQDIASTLREKMTWGLKNQLKDNPFQGVIMALTVGEQSLITQPQWEVFRRTGTTHLMAISGSHIGLVASFAFFVIFRFLRGRKLSESMPALTLAALSALGMSLFYSELAGWGIPVQRSCIMVVAVMVGVFTRRWVSSTQSMSLALFLVLILDPFAVFKPGFWLSFAAVGILFVTPWLTQPISGYKKWLYPQFWIFLGLMPLTLLWFHEFSLWSLVVNIIAIPWISFVTVPLALLGALLCLYVPMISTWLFDLATLSLDLVWALMAWFASLPLSSIQVNESVYTLILAVGGLFLLLVPQHKKTGLLCFVPLFLPSTSMLDKGDILFSVLDVGQGTATVIQTQNHTMIYDLGPKYPTGFDAGEHVIYPFFKFYKIKKLDLIVVSHADNDHSGGLNSVMQRLPASLITSNTKALPYEAKPCLKGDRWTWDGVTFEFLHPTDILPKKKNNQSCVLKVSNETHSILLPGDIEGSVEHDLLEENIKADILLVPHHGSLTSSSKAFIEAVAPKYAIFTTGHENQFGFPKSEIMQRYDERGVSLLNSTETGAIQFLVSKKELKEPVLWREQQRGFWTQSQKH